MAIYSESEKDRLLMTPIPEILEHFGKDSRPRGKGVYLSPLRTETSPSFHVHMRKNTWYDFGMGVGGGVVDLVCRLSGCERRDALDMLSIINGRYPDAVSAARMTSGPSRPDESPIDIIRVSQSFSNRALIRYAESRGIKKEIIDRHCQEVTYSFRGHSSWRITAIGFMNDMGGYSLRNSRSKLSNSSFISTITVPGSREVLVFEGFFDFLSHLAHTSAIEVSQSICVLNGVGNVLHSLPVLQCYEKICLYLDNDQAGRRTAETITGHCAGRKLNCDAVCQVQDMSHIYKGYNDYNSMLMGMMPSINKPETKDIMEFTVSKEVQQRLDKINWENLKEKYGISRESVMNNPHIASQLAYGQMTDLIQGSTKELSGMFSLRAYPTGNGDTWAVKVYTMEKAKTAKDNLTVYNQPVTSEKVKEALFERTSWIDHEGKKRTGLANANGGRPISLTLDGRKQECLVSVHQPTNRIVIMPVEQVRSYMFDQNGELRGRSLYGVQFTKEQANALVEGKAVVITGQRKDGSEFKCCAQFDAAQRQIVPCHPTWFKEAMRAGMDVGNNVGQEQSQNQKAANGQSKAEAPVKTPAIRK